MANAIRRVRLPLRNTPSYLQLHLFCTDSSTSKEDEKDSKADTKAENSESKLVQKEDQNDSKDDTKHDPETKEDFKSKFEKDYEEYLKRQPEGKLDVLQMMNEVLAEMIKSKGQVKELPEEEDKIDENEFYKLLDKAEKNAKKYAYKPKEPAYFTIPEHTQKLLADIDEKLKKKNADDEAKKMAELEKAEDKEEAEDNKQAEGGEEEEGANGEK